MKFTAAELIRIIMYVGAVVGGLVAIVGGVVRGDAALVATGVGLVTIGGTAAPNVPATADADDEPAG